MSDLSFAKSSRPSLASSLLNVTSEKHRRTRLYNKMFFIGLSVFFLFCLVSTGIYFFVKLAPSQSVGQLTLRLMHVDFLQEALFDDIQFNQLLSQKDKKFALGVINNLKEKNNELTLEQTEELEILLGQLTQKKLLNPESFESQILPEEIQKLSQLFVTTTPPSSHFLFSSSGLELTASKTSVESLSSDNDLDKNKRQKRRPRRGR